MADILKKTPSNKLLPIIKNPKYYEDFKNNERAAGQRKDNAWREKVVKDSEWTDIMDDLRMTPAQRKNFFLRLKNVKANYKKKSINGMPKSKKIKNQQQIIFSTEKLHKEKNGRLNTRPNKSLKIFKMMQDELCKV